MAGAVGQVERDPMPDRASAQENSESDPGLACMCASSCLPRGFWKEKRSKINPGNLIGKISIAAFLPFSMYTEEKTTNTVESLVLHREKK